MDLSFEESTKFDQWVSLLNVASRSSPSSLNKTSIFKGVTLCTRSDRYKAITYINGVQVYIGIYDTQREAYEARARVISSLSNSNE